MTTVNSVEIGKIEQFIPLLTICAALQSTPVTVERHLERYGIPLARLSRKKRGLWASDFELLMARTRKETK